MPDAVSGAASAPTTYATQQLDRGDQMGKDTFLKLLVAQMRYQDPSKPVDSSQMIAQTATFTQVEKLEQIAKSSATALVLQEHAAAGAMVGRQVTYTDTNGVPVTGLVSSVRLASGNSEAVAVVDGKEVQVGRITTLSTPTPSSGTSSSAAS
ncbi:flagellar hook assembly protein FlgD [Blastococcus goldschmidtiae]|uniref:Flagellar hook capping FlgD N-terminal domain-containing protein n=1 Tax=Blastococcus goldschmidtiae TaxID=3075546 RepID=A0ABU2K628_9ACTN|nr:flagellar hook capping FlgD N-terminal domain-containing protein [Blastococcus sp. DSM 46792]MDT0275651.1 flagellar hook capping FlgD N-terminal domain-containing protein [Blastococcus sp. DSM 46792]